MIDPWSHPLPVRALAVASVQAAASAAQALAETRGLSTRVTVDPVLTMASFDSIRHLRVNGRPVTAFAPLSGFFEAADGWVRLHGNYPHHRAALARALGSQDRDRAVALVRRLPAQGVEDMVHAAGGIAAVVRTAAQWRVHPQGAAVAADPLVDIDLISPPHALPPIESSPPLASASGSALSLSLPLRGIRVLDLTRVVAGPTATRLLGALGADVLRIDSPHLPELLGHHLDGDFAKRTAAADLTDPVGRQRVEMLLAAADVLITGYRPGALRQLGLDAAAAIGRHPQLIGVELCAWGLTGPWAMRRGFDSIVQAAVGISDRYGASDPGDLSGRRPGALPVQALDHATGYLAAAATMDLLAGRGTSGARRARLSLARTAHELMTMPSDDSETAPQEPVVPQLRAAESPHARLAYVGAPLVLDGVPLDYPTPPDRYASAPLSWATA